MMASKHQHSSGRKERLHPKRQHIRYKVTLALIELYQYLVNLLCTAAYKATGDFDKVHDFATLNCYSYTHILPIPYYHIIATISVYCCVPIKRAQSQLDSFEQAKST